MGEKDQDLDKIFAEDAERKRRKHRERKSLKVREYLKLVTEDPRIAQNSPSRQLEMILAQGMDEIPEDERWLRGLSDDNTKSYRAFSKKLFGLERQTHEYVQWLKTGAARLSTGKSLLIMVGPPGAAKSSFVTRIKNLLENYSTRQVFSLKGCPLNEEPLHVVPRYMREQAERSLKDCAECTAAADFGQEAPAGHLHLGVKIEGDLCPPCRYKLAQEFTDPKTGEVRWWDMEVETFTFSIQGTRGIGSFEPADEKNQDVGDLVGKEIMGISQIKGTDHPASYAIRGELAKGNRGLVEGRELPKAEEEFLWVFISVAEEKEFKVKGSSLPHVSVDTVVIGHGNLDSFKEFMARKDAALHNRIYVIEWPYPTLVRDELATYNKLIREDSEFAHIQICHIAPGSLELAALFAILTRLVPSKQISLLGKAKAYNGDIVLTELRDKEQRPIDLDELRKEGQADQDIAKHEGMFGVGPRDVLAALNTKIVESAGRCLTPLRTVQALRDVFPHRMGYKPEEVDRFMELLSAGEGGSVYAEYRDFVVRAVKDAFLRTHQHLMTEYRRKYRENVKLYLDQKRKFIPLARRQRGDAFGRIKEPDDKFMRSIEQHLTSHVDENNVDSWRAEYLIAIGDDAEEYPLIDRAIEEKIITDNIENLTVVLAEDVAKNKDQVELTQLLFQGLKSDGFCEICAKETAEEARKILRK